VNADGLWYLPGPKRFLDGLISDVFSGCSSIIFAPTFLHSFLASRIRFELRAREYRVDTVENDKEPSEGIIQCLEEASVQAGVFDRLVASGTRAFLVVAESRDSQSLWLVFLRRYQHHALRFDAQSRASIIVVTLCTQTDQRDEVGLKTRFWRNVWGETESLCIAEFHKISALRQDTIERIVVHTIARLALWDEELAELLSRKGTEILKDPTPIIINYAKSRGWNQTTQEDENEGTVGYQNGDMLLHTAYLALRISGNESQGAFTDELHRRRWHGQAVVLLPWIEEQRQKLVKLVGRFVSDPTQAVSLEVGPLWFEIRNTNAPSADKKKVFVLRQARNKLAHGNLLTLPELYELVGAFVK